MMSVDLLEKNLATSQTIQEFKNKSLGIIPNEDLIAFSETIEKFQFIYHELVVQPNISTLEVDMLPIFLFPQLKRQYYVN